jgi:hypothetical protein
MGHVLMKREGRCSSINSSIASYATRTDLYRYSITQSGTLNAINLGSRTTDAVYILPTSAWIKAGEFVRYPAVNTIVSSLIKNPRSSLPKKVRRDTAVS